MTRAVVTARENAPLKELARLLWDHRISGIPIVDAREHLVGIVTEADLLRIEEGEENPRRRAAFAGWLLHPKRLERVEREADGLTARNVMTRPVVSIAPEASIQQAVKTLLQAGVKRLPVTDPDGKLVGIVSRHDLLHPLLRSDEEIRSEVVKDVIYDAMWLDPRTIAVEVEQGVVTLEGTVERRSEKELLAELVRRVAGVVGVNDRLTYTHDDRGIKPAVDLPRDVLRSTLPSTWRDV